MYCKYCGQQINDDAYVCVHCGRVVAEQPRENKPNDVNIYAVLSLVFAFLMPVAGIVLGVIGMSDAKKTGGNGRGLAVAGLTLSIVFIVLAILALVVYLSMFNAILEYASSVGGLSVGFVSAFLRHATSNTDNERESPDGSSGLFRYLFVIL